VLISLIESKDEDLVDQHACRVYFMLNCLFFAHHPTAWTLGLVVSVHANELKVRYGMARLELHGRSRSQTHFNCKILEQHQLPIKVGTGIHA
jgi:hypothetical protein